MATPDAALEILLSLRDEATQGLTAFGGNVKGFSDTLEQHRGKLLGVSGALLAAGGASIKYASDLEESRAAMETTFGDASEVVTDFADEQADAFNVSRQAAFEYSAQLGGILKASGLTAEGSADMSVELVKLAADMASFKNLEFDVALEKIRAGLVGEAEPLRTVGVLLSDAAVRAKAAEMGLGDLNGELTEGEKVQARFAIILEQTADAQGDVARTADSAANQQRNLSQQAEDAAGQLGTSLLPMYAALVGAGADAVGVFADMPAPMQSTVVAAGAVTAGLAVLGLAIPPIVNGFMALRAAALASNAVLLANPVAIAVVGAALVAGVVAWKVWGDAATDAGKKGEEAIGTVEAALNRAADATVAQIDAEIAKMEELATVLETVAHPALMSIEEAERSDTLAAGEHTEAVRALVDEYGTVPAAVAGVAAGLEQLRQRKIQAVAAADTLRKSSIDLSNAQKDLQSTALAAAIAERILAAEMEGGEGAMVATIFAMEEEIATLRRVMEQEDRFDEIIRGLTTRQEEQADSVDTLSGAYDGLSAAQQKAKDESDAITQALETQQRAVAGLIGQFQSMGDRLNQDAEGLIADLLRAGANPEDAVRIAGQARDEQIRALDAEIQDALRRGALDPGQALGLSGALRSGSPSEMDRVTSTLRGLETPGEIRVRVEVDLKSQDLQIAGVV